MLAASPVMDAVAMFDGSAGTDDYLAEWRRAAPVGCGDDLEAEAEAAAQRLEETYDPEVLRRLVSAGGWDGAEGSDG